MRAEVAGLIGASPERLWRLAKQCARDALWAVRANPHPARVLAYRDPLPPSTRVALARLRRQSGWGDAER